LSFSDARDLLRAWREDFVRRSDDVVDLWESYLRDSSTQLSDERWMIPEQVKYLNENPLLEATIGIVLTNFGL